jgi:protein-S-isoprenylcysteine O-methyltransferase Ste14
MTLTADKSPASRRPLDGGRVFDLVERGFLLALSLSAIVRLAPALRVEPDVLLILISEGLAVAFILLRRPATHADHSPYAAGVAFLGTAAPLLVTAPGHGLIPPVVGFWVMIAGLLMSISAKVALNRSFGLAAANRGVKREGPYRFLRHPMYAGYAANQVAFLLLNPCLWNLAIYALGWSVQILRIRAEEKLLMEDPAYRAYASQVRFRLMPGLY